MSVLVSLFIHGDPKPQPRARVTVRGGHARAYTPALANDWKAAIVRAIRSSDARLGHPGAVLAYCTFYLPRPASHWGKQGLRKGAPARPTSPRFDIDNLVKSTFDAISDAGLWLDDGQVITVSASKYWAQLVGPSGMQLEVHAL